MTERSRFWNGLVLGDAVEAPYDAQEEFARVQQSVAGVDTDVNGGKVFSRALNELACSLPVGTGPINVATGRAIVDGTWYENDAIKSLTPTVPGAGFDYGYVVLTKDAAVQTVRLALVQQAGSLPALTQTHGVTWQYPLYSYMIASVSGVIVLTDLRTFAPYGSGGSGMELLAKAIVSVAAASIVLTESAIKPFARYPALKLVLRGRTMNAGTEYDAITIQFNADGAASYDAGTLTTIAASVTQAEVIAGTSGPIGYLRAGGGVADNEAGGFIEVDIHHKDMDSVAAPLAYLDPIWMYQSFVDYDHGTAAHWIMETGGGRWRRNISITSVTVLAANNFAVGTEVYLYGLPRLV